MEESKVILVISQKESIVRTDFSKHINRNDGNGLMRSDWIAARIIQEILLI